MNEQASITISDEVMIELDNQITRMGFLMHTAEALEMAMCEGDSYISGEAWAVPLEQLWNVYEKLEELTDACREARRQQSLQAIVQMG